MLINRYPGLFSDESLSCRYNSLCCNVRGGRNISVTKTALLIGGGLSLNIATGKINQQWCNLLSGTNINAQYKN